MLIHAFYIVASILALYCLVCGIKRDFFNVTVIILFALLNNSADAQCKQLYAARYVYAAPIQQQIVTYQPYQNYTTRYFLGEDVQVEALAQKIVAELERKQLVFKTDNSAAPVSPQAPTNNTGGGLSIRQLPLFSAKCARCHTGKEPISGISFDDGMPDKSFRKFVRMFRSNKDIPKGMLNVIAGLTPEQKGAITEEVVDFYSNGNAVNERVEVVPPPKPSPPSEGDLK